MGEREASDYESLMGELFVRIDYTNWRGERRERVIVPRGIRFAKTEHHPEIQWLLDAFDAEKGAERTFAMKDIHSWTNCW